MTNILRMVDITKKFGSVTALENVCIDLNSGEVLALVGENGAGKSTLMNVLSGTYPWGAFAGRIFVDGAERFFKSPKESKDAGIEMIHQEISLHRDLTVAENMFMGELPRRHRALVNWKETFAQAARYLKTVGLDVNPRETLRNLSTSQQQLLSIAKALARHPRILVLDEPTSALTETETKTLFGIIRKLCSTGISCIYISHHLEEVFEIADRVMVLRDGNIVSMYERGRLEENRIIEDMVGRKIDAMYPKQKASIGEEALRVENLTVSHPYIKKKNIVEGIGFHVQQGEILGVAGLVGTGRSETMNAIFGTLKRTSGDIFLHGRKIDIHSPLQAIEHGIGLVTEDRKKSGFIPSMSVKQNMTIASLRAVSRNGVISGRIEEGVARRFFDRLRIKGESVDSGIASLSGGNQQKTVLAKWLMKDLKVLILDEPTRGVDVGARVEIYHIITELVTSGVAVIMVSSDLPELLGMCDRLIVLFRGKIRAEMPRDEATPEKIMRAATGLEEYFR